MYAWKEEKHILRLLETARTTMFISRFPFHVHVILLFFFLGVFASSFLQLIFHQLLHTLTDYTLMMHHMVLIGFRRAQQQSITKQQRSRIDTAESRYRKVCAPYAR